MTNLNHTKYPVTTELYFHIWPHFPSNLSPFPNSWCRRCIEKSRICAPVDIALQIEHSVARRERAACPQWDLSFSTCATTGGFHSTSAGSCQPLARWAHGMCLIIRTAKYCEWKIHRFDTVQTLISEVTCRSVMQVEIWKRILIISVSSDRFHW